MHHAWRWRVQAQEQMSRADDAVRSLAASHAADPRHRKYHLSVLRRAVAAIDGAPSGSTERHERRLHATQLCLQCVNSGAPHRPPLHLCRLRLH